MSGTRVAMTDERRDDFLGRGGTGVLSLSTADGPPHAVPVSYGYDHTAATFYFRLAVGGGRSKGELPDRPVSFVTYDVADGDWHSVVAEGRLEDVDQPDIETETLAGLDHVDIPLFDSFDEPTRAVSFEFYRLVPERLTARTGD